MKRFLASPAVNAVCISIFSAFYAIVFFLINESVVLERDLVDYIGSAWLWWLWRDFLAAGYHRGLALVLVAVTVLVVVLLLVRRRPHDEYHTAILIRCLVVAIVLTLIAIALLYLMILGDTTGVMGKFTLFIAIHWATVVFANLVYVLLCRRG